MMALLTRYCQLQDSDESHVFNFVVTKSVTRDLSRDVVSRDFVCASHRWALTLVRQEKVFIVAIFLDPDIIRRTAIEVYGTDEENEELNLHFAKEHIFIHFSKLYTGVINTNINRYT